MFGFLPRDDQRPHSSVLAIADELTEDGFVLRYRTDETDDGLSGKEGSFFICSFWLVSALARRRRPARATSWSGCSGSPRRSGLYAEEFDVDTARHLGNFPQAFSHLALIEAAARIVAGELRDEPF
jgi:GH15 family glucan-1,4-alpha-glucosidase